MNPGVSKRMKRFLVGLVLALFLVGVGIYTEKPWQQVPPPAQSPQNTKNEASQALEMLAVKGRAPKTGYSRSQFGNGWAKWRNCDTRNRILARDLTQVTYKEDTCVVQSGVLNDPYTGKVINFERGPQSANVQIDHVVALSDAWQKGAQLLTPDQREQLANDDLELLAADGPANEEKGAGDAATWLPKNKSFRCQYVARQIAIKRKYSLWVTATEKDAMKHVLFTCSEQALPRP